MPRPRVTTRITVFDPIEQFAPPKDRSPLAQPSSPTASSFGPWNRLKLPPATADIPLLANRGISAVAGGNFSLFQGPKLDAVGLEGCARGERSFGGANCSIGSKTVILVVTRGLGIKGQM